MNHRSIYRALQLTALALSLRSAALAQGDAITWESLPGPYGGPITHLAADSSGGLYAVVGEAFAPSTIYVRNRGDREWRSTGSLTRRIQSLAATPSGMLIAGTEGGGVIRSTDSGATWTPAPGFDNGFVWGIAALPDGTVAAGGQFGDVSVSTDNGDSWTTLLGLPNNVFIQGIAIGRDGEIIIGTTAAGVYVVTGGNAPAATKAALDEGVTAMLVLPDGDLIAGTAGGKIHRIRKSQGSWSVVAGDTLDGRVNAIALSPAGLPIASTATGLYASAEDGSSWTRLDAVIPPSGIGSIVLTREGEIYAATRDGAFRAPSISSRPITFEPLSAGMRALKITSLATAADGALIAGTRSGTIYRSGDNGESWTKVLVIPTVAQNSLYGGVNNLAARGAELYASTYGSGIYRSTDNGLTWNARNEGFTDLQMINVAIDSSGGVIASGISTGLHRSADAGGSWSRLPLDQEYIPEVVVAPNGDLLVGVGETVMRSATGGATWSSVRTVASPVQSLLGTASGEIYVGTFNVPGENTGVYRIGANNAITKLGTMQGPVQALARDRSGRLYAGVEGGGVHILDPGATAMRPASNGLADRQVMALALGRDGDRIYAGVEGGIAAAAIGASGVDREDRVPTGPALGLCSPNPASSGTVIPFSLAARAHVRLEIYNAAGERVATLLAGDLAAGEHTASWDVREVGSGLYWYRLQAGGGSRTGTVVVRR